MKTYLKTKFIYYFLFFIRAIIIYNEKLDNSINFYIKYGG